MLLLQVNYIFIYLFYYKTEAKTNYFNITDLLKIILRLNKNMMMFGA